MLSNTSAAAVGLSSIHNHIAQCTASEKTSEAVFYIELERTSILAIRHFYSYLHSIMQDALSYDNKKVAFNLIHGV
jgi:hypothetical protein